MSAPLIVVNCKTYAQASGIAAEALAVEMQAIDTNARLVLAASALDIASVASAAPDLEVWAQHLDPVGYGSNTGRIHPKTAIERGATGTLSNHAERKVPIGQIDELLAALPPGFDLCACAADPKEAEALAHLAPPMIAVEPPELIGGDISVTTSDPTVVSSSVEVVRKVDSGIDVLCGAGVKTGEDVAAALDLGAAGVLLASGVTKADDPKAVLLDLVSKI